MRRENYFQETAFFSCGNPSAKVYWSRQHELAQPNKKMTTTTPTTIKPGCYAMILTTGKAGRITGKGYGRFQWGMSWSHDEYTKAPSWKTEGFEPNEIRRISPAEYHSLPADRKITGYGQD
jgi:hypothetical protein